MVAVVWFVATLLSVTAADEYFEGDGTSYTLGQVSSGNCNFMSAIPTASTNFVALNQEQWNTLGNCGRCIEVSCIDDQCTAKNKTAIVQVLDRCPECAHGALDLSPTVYKEITGLEPNRLTVRWRFVDCPNPGNVQVCLKGGSSSSWIAVQPANCIVGVESVTVNGATTTMLDGAYYYVSTQAKADLSAVKVAITSVSGEVVSGTFSLKEGECTDTNMQFGSDYSSQSPSQTVTPVKKGALATTPAPVATTAAPEDTSVNQEAQGPSTEVAPEATPVTPEATTATPEATPVTPEATTATPEATPVSLEAEVPSTDVTPEAQGPVTPVPPEATTATPEATPVQVPSTEATPEAQGPATPEATTATPEATPVSPEAQVPAAPVAPVAPATPEAQGSSTEAIPEAAAVPTTAPTQSGDTSKCHVKGHRKPN